MNLMVDFMSRELLEKLENERLKENYWKGIKKC